MSEIMLLLVQPTQFRSKERPVISEHLEALQRLLRFAKEARPGMHRAIALSPKDASALIWALNTLTLIREMAAAELVGCPHCEWDEAEGTLMNHCDACCRKVTAAAWELCQ